MQVRGSMGCTNHEMVDGLFFQKAGSQPLQRADFGLFGDLLRRILWDTALEKKGVQESWLIFKDHLL